MTDRGRRVRRLARAGELLLPLRVALVALLVPLLMRLSLPRLGAVLQRIRVAPEQRRGDVTRALYAIERLMSRFAPLIRHRCQVRGMTRFYFLRRAGVDVSLAFGVGRVDGAFAGHCWLVRDGTPYLERRDPRASFTEMYRLPEASRRGPTRVTRLLRARP